MSTGLYGTVVESTVSANDLDVFYGYTPNRNSPPSQMQPLYSANGPASSDIINLPGCEGSYSLRLPATVFNQLGYYMVLITNKSYSVSIVDCGVVISNTQSNLTISKNGIIIPASSFAKSNSTSGALTGYRIQYFDNNGNLIPNFFRIVTSSDLVSPAKNTNINQSNASYVLDSNGSYLFLTLAPDELTLIVPGQQQLGSAGQQIIISNTAVNPTMIEVNLTDVSLQSLAAVCGSYYATNNTSTGTYSVFNSDGSIYASYSLYSSKDQVTNGIIENKQIKAIDLNENYINMSQGL